MRPLLISLVLAAFLLSACVTATPEPLLTPTLTSTPAPADTPELPTSIPRPQRAPLLRVAVLGETTTTNVWALFDASGADYWNTATQTSYWPSLYRLAPPSLNPQPATAKGDPPPVECDALTCTATVTLQPNLTWTDGSTLTADDVAFTVNTALHFRLGLNWQQAYNPDVLDHAEAVDRSRVKFYFKGRPTVGDWQYDVLQGPIVNHVYWQPRIAEAVSLLPDDSLLTTIQELEGELAKMQADEETLNRSLNSMAATSAEYAQTFSEAQSLQDELNSINNKLAKNRSAYETQLSEARAVLFQLGNANEPTLGSWKFASSIENQFENQANPGTPFGDPWFDRVLYVTYPNETEALFALTNGDVDIFLSPTGVSPVYISHLENKPEISLSSNLTRSARFLAVNQANPYLADLVLRRAMACVLDPQTLAERLSGKAVPLPGFVLDEYWQDKESSLPCSGGTSAARLTEAVKLLMGAGYSWDREPAAGVDGTGLKDPAGNVLPSFNLLAPEQDSLRNIAAKYIAQQAKALGLTVDVRMMGSNDLLYAVYGSGEYDMALLGWRLSAYPAYLCGWFVPSDRSPFAYNGSNPTQDGAEGLVSVCESWGQTSDLEVARSFAFEVQSILMQDLPLIPLYVEVRVDAYRNVHFPFTSVIDGLGGLYGAPALAMPNP
jgi:ABC-type transport system substrate-binding protein